MLLAVGVLPCSKFLFSLTDDYLLGGVRQHTFVLTQLPLLKDPGTDQVGLHSHLGPALGMLTFLMLPASGALRHGAERFRAPCHLGLPFSFAM